MLASLRGMRVVAIAAGMGAGVAAFFVAFGWAATAAAGGHGSYLPAKILFPWGMLVAQVCEYISDVALVVGALQFPAYGILLGSSSTWRSFGRRMAILCAVHAVGAVVAAHMVTWAQN